MQGSSTTLLMFLALFSTDRCGALRLSLFSRRASVTLASQQEILQEYSAPTATPAEKCGCNVQQSEQSDDSISEDNLVKLAPASPATDVPWKQEIIDDIYDSCGDKRQPRNCCN